MRQRKIKDIEEKLIDYMDLVVSDPIGQRGRWLDAFTSEGDGSIKDSSASASNTSDAALSSDCEGAGELFIEIGCGKGRFITASAKESPEDYFVAIEGFSSVIYRALQKVREEGLENVRFILDFVFDLGTWFADGEASGIFLNFSDPWPKKKNAKRRLTYRDRLEQYAKVLKSGGFLRIKTDNDDFFEFTLEEVEAIKSKAGFEIEYMTRDLHESPWHDKSPLTEYEAKFSGVGKNINFLALKKI